MTERESVSNHFEYVRKFETPSAPKLPFDNRNNLKSQKFKILKVSGYFTKGTIG